MPTLRDSVIRRAWRMRNETGRIHYIALYADGKERHLIAKEDHALYGVLDSHLLAIGYTGPADNDAGESAESAE